MRDDQLLLADIQTAARAIIEFSAAKQRQDLERDRLLQSALLHQFAIIGEAASNLSRELKARHSMVPWQAICGFRNIVIHEYFALDLDIVWEAVTADVPRLLEQVTVILGSDFATPTA
jgi:uncharacterized protein with HEPN domain